MLDKRAIRAEADRLRQVFESAGADPVDPDILLPAAQLLDLYGEDIRARAFVTSDPLGGEAMLRPDFTVPVTLWHLEHGAGPARYTYAGEVFRRQAEGSDRAMEYLQVGFELFGADDPAAADAEVFKRFAEIVAPFGLKAATGDIGLLKSAVRALHTTSARKAQLMRHLWRPRRFRALLDQFAGLGALRAAPKAAWDETPEIGLRTRQEVKDRFADLEADRSAPPLSEAEAGILDDLLALKDTVPSVLTRLADFAVDLPGIAPAVDLFEARAEALSSAGVEVDKLEFEGSYGRTTLEYYDGFVFGFSLPGRPDQPPVAGGGRYDALTEVLGKGEGVPAVGGVIRPALTLRLGATT